MNFAEFQRRDRRLVILRALHSAAQYRANAILLARYCDAVSHVVSSDVLAADLAWLEEAGLVGNEHAAGVMVATLTERGQEVATGRAEHPGVQRPQPGG